MTNLTRTQVNNLITNLPFRNQAFINGEFVAAKSGNIFDSINPATGEIVAEIAHCNHDDVDKAVKAARMSFESGVWSRSAPEHRKEILLRLADLIFLLVIIAALN